MDVEVLTKEVGKKESGAALWITDDSANQKTRMESPKRHKISPFIVNFYIVLLLTQCCSVFATLQFCSRYYLPEKTKGIDIASSVSLQKIFSTSPMPAFECPHTARIYKHLHLYVQNSSCLHYQNPCLKPGWQAYSETTHKSTVAEITSSSVLSIIMSIHSTDVMRVPHQTSYPFFESLIQPMAVEVEHLIYATSTSEAFADKSGYSNLLPSFTYSHDKQLFLSSTEYLDGITSWKSSADKCKVPEMLQHCLPIISNTSQIIREHQQNKGSLMWQYKVLQSSLEDYDKKYLQRQEKQRDILTDSLVSSISRTLVKYLVLPYIDKRDPKRFLNDFTLLHSMENMISFGHSSDSNIVVNGTSWGCDNSINATGFEDSASKKNIYSNSDISRASEYAWEFQTFSIKSDPQLLTNMKSKYSVYCRLCETTLNGRGIGMKGIYTISPTFTNLDFPVPETRSAKSFKSEILENDDGYRVNEKENIIRDSFVFEKNVSPILSTSPPCIFPVPSTKYSSLSTEVPYIVSYELTFDRTLYYSDTWSKQKILRSAIPSLFPEQRVPLAYKIEKLPHVSKLNAPFDLESSIRSIPEVIVQSTEMQSFMTAQL